MDQRLILVQPNGQVRVAEVNCEQHELIIMPWEVILRIYTSTDGPILQTGENVLYQAKFGITKQVRVDIAQRSGGSEPPGHPLPATRSGKDAIDGRGEVRLDAGNPIGTDILAGQSLADEFTLF